jgi:hypothetical protein
MNTNPAVWGPEAQIFNPDRWLVPGGMPSPAELPSGWSGLLTFCDGPRNCIGWRLGEFFFRCIFIFNFLVFFSPLEILGAFVFFLWQYLAVNFPRCQLFIPSPN